MLKSLIALAALAAMLSATGPVVAKDANTTTVHLTDIKKHCKLLVLQFSAENVTDPNARKASAEGEKNCASYDPGTVILGMSQVEYALKLIGITPESR